ncbi:hypothetical protein KIN20_004366 [Parelaphostrongylus tenuis]|uniref:Uncharacterized protein n=1 Tax=Parelaphostrongylus tenuis TaxID=148309 RepID=A0AAD5QEE7_PARTN|nr:hypothetical protein KIN20_004366 [Parelaphostrongylus tenuis]
MQITAPTRIHFHWVNVECNDYDRHNARNEELLIQLGATGETNPPPLWSSQQTSAIVSIEKVMTKQDSLPTSELKDSMPMPKCGYSVRRDSPNGPILTFANVGDTAHFARPTPATAWRRAVRNASG